MTEPRTAEAKSAAEPGASPSDLERLLGILPAACPCDIDQFVALLGHELRNPLAPIRNAVQILRVTPGGEPEAEWAIDVIERQTDRLARLVDQLLDLARGRPPLDLRRERVRLADVLRTALESGRPAVEARGHELRAILPDEHVEVFADPERLAEAIAQLLDGVSRRAARGARVRLEAAREQDQVLVTIGAEPAAPATAAAAVPGTGEADPPAAGIGIAFWRARRVADLHGGSVEARIQGGGTAFLLRLPTSARVREIAARAPGAARVLVVDDNEDAVFTLSEMLRAAGYDVRTAADGPEALSTALAFRPEAVLLDIGLPGMDGCEVARRIRDERWGRSTLLIATTGWGQDEDRRRSHEAGFDYHLVKPVDPAELITLLNKARAA